MQTQRKKRNSKQQRKAGHKQMLPLQSGHPLLHAPLASPRQRLPQSLPPRQVRQVGQRAQAKLVA
jgi:hypothetical protein